MAHFFVLSFLFLTAYFLSILVKPSLETGQNEIECTTSAGHPPNLPISYCTISSLKTKIKQEDLTEELDDGIHSCPEKLVLVLG